MTDQEGFQSNAPTSSKVSSNEERIIHLNAEKFNFETHVDFPSSVQTNPDKYAFWHRPAIDFTLPDELKAFMTPHHIPELYNSVS